MKIGVSAPNTPATRAAISTLCEDLNIQHISMRMASYSMVASLVGIHPVELIQSCAKTEVVGMPGITLADLEQVISDAMRRVNPSVFINMAQKDLENKDRLITKQFFDGYLISGIDSNEEAEWIRQQGGVVLHIGQRDASNAHVKTDIDSDEVIELTGTPEDAPRELRTNQNFPLFLKKLHESNRRAKLEMAREECLKSVKEMGIPVNEKATQPQHEA